MNYLQPILALLVGIAGWYYMFYSKAAVRLAGVEVPRTNALRVWLRRINGLVMVLFAIGLFVAWRSIDPDKQLRTFALLWLLLTSMLFLMILLALIDLRMTQRLRRQRARQDPK